MITQASIEALKSRLDIVDVVSAYIPLKKSGLNFGACCPFHGEKTASFVVSFQKQIYHCFGCGVSGDAIKFVQEFEKISFSEAVEKLANNFGITLSYDKQKETINAKGLEEFANYFKSNLAKNAFVKEYLSKRNVSQESIEKFALGFAPTSKEQIDYAISQHLLIPELVELGVFSHGEKGLYARFTERLIFPIKNANGKIIGFGGRTLSNHPAKYINSQATKLFDKSSVLYGFDAAKEAIAKQKELILCEGYMDVIALHQSGFTNATAVLGTALTQKHLPQIKRFDAKVILSFDGDKAGLSAGFKSANLLIQNDVLGKVVKWGEGIDPADLINKPQEITERLNLAESLYEFILKTEVGAFNLSDIGEKQRAAKRIGEVLNGFGEIAANELKGFASALLGVGEVKVFRQKQVRNYSQKINVEYKEASIIRAMAQSHALLEYGATRLAPELFRVQRLAFEALVSGDEESLELLQTLSSDEITLINSELFYEYANSLKKDFLNYAFKVLKETSSAPNKPELLRQIAKEKAKTEAVDDEFLEQVLSCYNQIKK